MFDSGRKSMDDSKKTLSATVKGYVQGVGFRIFVRGAAWRLGVKGFVKNMPEGTVKVVASGDDPSLETLLQAIRRGPVGAHVTAVDTDWQEGEAEGLPEPFEVRP
jgi:acylphosphatase